jgi:hypothetical protein
LQSANARIIAHFNRIISTTTAIDNPGNVVTNLENNWWGCNAGPGNTGCGTVNGTGADFNPWIVLGASASPTSIPPGGSSTITADMTLNSDNVAPSGTDFVPQVSVTFSATNGTIGPSPGTITSGQAVATFTSNTNANGQACATVDTQQACTAAITVVLPSFSIDDVTLAEGNAGTTSFTFTITKTGAGPASVDYATVNGTATAPSDFTAIPTTTLSFLSGDLSKQVTVQVKGDTANELSEAFTVHLSNPVTSTISDSDGLGTITNDDSCGALGTVYVNKSWLGTAAGDDPDAGRTSDGVWLRLVRHNSGRCDSRDVRRHGERVCRDVRRGCNDQSVAHSGGHRWRDEDRQRCYRRWRFHHSGRPPAM